MQGTFLKKSAAVIICAALVGGALYAQSTASQPSGGGRLDAVFPEENPNLVFVEGEDAVSTNFAREPVLNYSCSGSRTLQLNSASGLQGVGSFYADYAFRVPAAGVYELWYGGTPPGPREDIYPSYASPFQILIDSTKPLPIYRENMSVVESYSPSYYWNLVGDVTLDTQTHRMRFEITEKRKIDGRYFFYLDCFFLVKKEDGKRTLTPPLPAIFPKNLDDRSINSPFLSFDDSLIRIRDNPGKVQPFIDLSLLYTMLGDYLNALKYLNRAALLDPENAEVLLLLAKNRVWKGDVAEGLKKYRELLGRDSKRHDLWMEAGKVAAWMGQYNDSEYFFTNGLANFPKDPELTVNLGLTYLWAGRGTEAEKTFKDAQNIAGSDSGLLKRLGRVYRVNGYPDRAITAFQAALRAAPQDLEAYFLLIDTDRTLGRTTDADKTEQLMSATFLASPRLSTTLDGFKAQESTKQQVIDEYRTELAAHPDNLVLRQVLAQTYFWNGRKKEAIEEYRHILANHAYLALNGAESRSPDLLRIIDESFVIMDFLGRASSLAQKSANAISSDLSTYRGAFSRRDSARKALDAANADLEKRKAAAQAGQTSSAQADEEKAAAAAAAAEQKLRTASDALDVEAVALTTQIEDGRALIAQIQGIFDAVVSEGDAVSALQQSDEEEQRAFTDLTKGNKWKWDKFGAETELRSDAPHDTLSRLVLAKVYLSDGQAVDAQSLLGKTADSGMGVELRYVQVRSLLWGGKVPDAVSLISSLSSDPAAASLPPYFGHLTGLIGRLSPAAGQPSPAISEDPEAEAKAVSEELGKIGRSVETQKTSLQKRLDLLRGLYFRAVMRAFYSFEGNAYAIRNELGDYYEGEQQLDSAILQFRKVLAIDPGNLSAQFRLGKIYQWNRDWRGALDAYLSVYNADPYFENVASLFNQVSRDHADSLSSTTSFFSDPSRTQWHADVAYTHLLGSVFSLTAAYQADDWRINRTVGALVDHSAFQVQDASVGIPIDLYFLNLKITPSVGGSLTGNGLFSRSGAINQVPLFTNDLFELYAVEPRAAVDVGLEIQNLFSLTSTFRWGRYAETFDPLRTAVYDSSVEANLSIPLAFFDVYPLHDTTLRTYGKIDYLTDLGFGFQNMIVTAAEEVTIYLFKGGNPYSLLALIGNGTFQDSSFFEPNLYYSPQSELTAGASLMGSTWIGVGGGAVLGLSLRGFAGAYTQKILTDPSIYGKFEGEADVSVTQASSTFTLTSVFDAAMLINNPAAIAYWSFVVRFGYSTKLPQILAP